jgi:hypothetical protein
MQAPFEIPFKPIQDTFSHANELQLHQLNSVAARRHCGARQAFLVSGKTKGNREYREHLALSLSVYLLLTIAGVR